MCRFSFSPQQNRTPKQNSPHHHHFPPPSLPFFFTHSQNTTQDWSVLFLDTLHNTASPLNPLLTLNPHNQSLLPLQRGNGMIYKVSSTFHRKRNAHQNQLQNMPSPPEIDGYENANWSSFQMFFQGWILRQQHYLEQLLTSANRPEDEMSALVSQVLSHYQQYYEAKSMVVRQDVYIVFTPPWFSPFERTFLWIAGFKPGLAFKILNNSVRDSLSEDQNERVRELMAETRVAEKELSDELARVQESIVAPPIVDMARLMRHNNNNRNDRDHRNEIDTGLRSLRKTMETLVESADFLRLTTARKVVEILSPGQAVTFLAAATQLQLKVREMGYQRDAELRRRARSSRGTSQRT